MVGGGSYYLTNGSPYTTAGTTNIDPDLLADLQQKTVWPPIVYADTNISSLGTLGPSVPRDINSFAAIGFHYNPLDVVFGGADLYSNLTVAAGTAIGWFEEAGGVSTSGQPYSMTLNHGANLVFNGTATEPCYWSQYAMVQERGNNNWSGSGYMGSFTFNGSGSSPEPLLTANFTKFTVGNLAIIVRDNSGPGAGVFKNCEFYNDTIGAYDLTSLTFTNCLFFRDCMDFWAGDAIDFTNDNCTYYNGGLALSRTTTDNASFWSIENTIFDGTLLCFYDPYNGSNTYTAFNYNAYNTNNLSWQTYGFPYSNWLITNILENPGPNEVMTTNFNWESSWFGNFYLPSDSPLIDMGSTNANLLGLYEFTTQTNQNPETNAIVDIGYHYVATDVDGNPLDTYVSGLPNYILDSQGNGMDTNGLSYWWEGEYFGEVGLNTNSDPANDGGNLLLDYLNGVDPNIIVFFPQFPDVIHTNVATGSLTIIGGEPFYVATLVNDTNIADAVWQPYTGTNLDVSLGPDNGIYSVSVGLRGLPPNAKATWMTTSVTSESFKPSLVVISPTNSVVSQPIIQLQGLASEALSALTYDISNSLGVITNQQGYWTASFFDTNVSDFSTNAFQCYDISLASGLNVITVHATDLQGNTATTNITFTLDYSGATNPPNLTILWPQNGTPISGASFTLQAQVDDDTAIIVAQIADTNGDTSAVSGLVERGGEVWVNNMALAAGTNFVTVTATSTAGHSMTTNITLIRSQATVTVNPLTQPNSPSVSVTGTVSDPTVTLTVNGTSAYYLDTNGDWEADNVPVSPTGTANLDVEIYSDVQSWEGSQNFSLIQPPVVGLMSYSSSHQTSSVYYNECGTGSAAAQAESETINWLYQMGGTDSQQGGGINGDCQPFNNSSVENLPGGYGAYSPAWEISNTSENAPQSAQWLPVIGEGWSYYPVYGDESSSTVVNSGVAIFPSGQASMGQNASYLVSAQAFDEATGSQLPGSSLQIDGQTPTDVTNSDGSIWSQASISATAGANVNVTPVASDPSYNFDEQVYQLVSQCVKATPVNQARTNVGIGEQVNLYFNPTLPSSITNIIWSTTAGSISSTNGPSALFTAPDRATNATVSAMIHGQPISIAFNVIEPTNVYYLVFTNMHNYDEADIGFIAWTFLQPNSVNFYAVQAQEEQAYAVATGVYSYYNDSGHQAYEAISFGSVVAPGLGTGAIGDPADIENNLDAANDECYSGTTDPDLSIPYTNGTETLVVPWDFRVSTNDWKTNFVTLTWHCSKSDGGNDGEGLLNASKSNASVQMNVDDVSVGTEYEIDYIFIFP